MNTRALAGSLLGFLVFLAALLPAQETFPTNGVKDKNLTQMALVGATVYLSPTEKIEKATILIEGKRIKAVGKDITIPYGAVVMDLKGKTIYPSFIDPYTSYGMPEVKRPKWEPAPQVTSNKKGPYSWNQAIHPEDDSFEKFSYNAKEAKALQSAGVGIVLSHAPDGIMRGSGMIIGLGADPHRNLLVEKASAHYSFSKGSSRQQYPSSLMGGIALLRQTYYDADWYASEANQVEENLSLKALNALQDLPQIFECREKFEVLRSDKVGDEFEVQYIFKGSGAEYQNIDEIVATGGSFILPLNFPLAYDVSDPFLSRMVSLEEMKHWEMAPSNPAALQNAEIPFAFTTHGLKSKDALLKQVRKALEYGLTREKAMEALTLAPAKMLGIEAECGSIAAGKLANLLIAKGDLFEDGEILENWVMGEQHVVKAWDAIDIAGDYNLSLNKALFALNVKEDGTASILLTEKNKESGKLDSTEVKVNLQRTNQLVTLTFEMEKEPYQGITRLTGNATAESRIWDGKGQLPDGSWIAWGAVRQAPDAEAKKEDEKKDSLKLKEMGAVSYPFMAYGYEARPEEESVLIRNATIWTCVEGKENQKIEKGQILIHEGKIQAIGENIDIDALFPKKRPAIKTIDARGKHVTPGIIDEHSHIAIRRGVNEGSQASSAEVRIGDVVESEDIDIYRQLAGGVTCSQLLHGSANPIGGQSALIKLRWGLTPEEMKVEGADGFIKFALGENVKQANWGDYYTSRFPQTRMGVEQVYYDYFVRAREYGKAWNAYDKAMANLTRKQKRDGDLPIPPRTDLELEAVLEILESERFVTCHSYMQHEINMLMHVADSMGFTLNTFTHILEGYKLADKMRAHGAGASSFSDWWAYKYEVKDAIPQNGALLWEQGITVAFNSDDAEMARRLNQEAAKAVKYGGVPETEALKFVTLNPAKLLHLDDRMGSLEVGKDADVVIWNDHPLSVYAQAEKTFVDGICYYDQDRDKDLRKAIEVERARLIQLMLGAKAQGEKTQKPQPKEKQHYHCDTLGDECH